jgi:hypothetical protein
MKQLGVVQFPYTAIHDGYYILDTVIHSFNQESSLFPVDSDFKMPSFTIYKIKYL